MEHSLDYGESSPESLAKWDRATSSWRTSQGSLALDSIPSSVILPRSGMMLNGTLYQRAPWEHHTHGSACSLWATPAARDHKDYPGVEKTVRRDGTGRIDQLARQVYAKGLTTKADGLLSPNWVEWLMGFDIGWTALDR